MGLQFLNNQVEFRAWCDGVQLVTYFMEQPQLEYFKAMLETAIARRNREDLMATRKAETQQGLFVQMDATEDDWKEVIEEQSQEEAKNEDIEQN